MFFLKENKKQFTHILVIIFIVALMITGCSSSSRQEVSDKQAGQQLEVYTVGDSDGDWGYPTPWGHYQRGPGYVRMSYIFDTLIWKDEAGFVPAIADKWIYDASNNSYEFQVRDDILWHDGKKLTCDDIVFTFQYMKEHPYIWVDMSCIESVQIKGKNTIEIKLNTPNAAFLTNIAATVPIIPKHVWENVEEPEKYLDSKAVIGCGPFKLLDYNKEQGTYQYEANENYYGGEIKVKQLRFVKVNDQMATAALSNGDVNAISIQPEMAENLKDSGFDVISESGSINVKLMFNYTKSPFDNIEFRQALAYAINRQDLVAKAQRGYGLEGNPGMLSPENSWYNVNVEQYKYDLAKNAEILGRLGYTRETSVENEEGFWAKDGDKLSFEILCSPDLIRAAEVLKEQLKKAGVDIRIKSLENKTRDAKIIGWDFDIALNQHGGLGGDPNTMNKLIVGDNFNSVRYFENAELVKVLKEQSTAMDEKERIELIDNAQKLYALDLPALTLYYPTYYWGHDGQIPLFYTKEGIGIGVPIPLNKLSFVNR